MLDEHPIPEIISGIPDSELRDTLQDAWENPAGPTQKRGADVTSSSPAEARPGSEYLYTPAEIAGRFYERPEEEGVPETQLRNFLFALQQVQKRHELETLGASMDLEFVAGIIETGAADAYITAALERVYPHASSYTAEIVDQVRRSMLGHALDATVTIATEELNRVISRGVAAKDFDTYGQTTVKPVRDKLLYLQAAKIDLYEKITG